jgi:hypothetical protein
MTVRRLACRVISPRPKVAALCRTSPETVRFWRYVGKGPTSFKLGRKVLYDATAVEEWLRVQQGPAQAG